MSAVGKTILSLFDHSGAWSQPYRDAGANVIQIDLKHGIDVMDVNQQWLQANAPKVDGMLIAFPCTHFAVSGNQHWPAKDADGRTEEMMKLLRHTMRIVEICAPDFWVLENPVGRIATLMPELGCAWYFHPCDFGDPYTKKTGLYGKFIPPLPLFIGGDKSVEPIMFQAKNGKRGSWMWAKLGGKSERTKELRSVTPPGFARAFFAANCWS